jgi:citrate lyase subunit beta/citryl-CoA lyase
LIPLIETAAGYLALNQLAVSRNVVRLAFGHLDFMTDTGISAGTEEIELAPVRFAMAVASRAAGIASAIDGVTIQLVDEAQLIKDTQRAVSFAFGAKLCIHPRQISVVHAALQPSEADVAWARRVLEAELAAQGAATQLEGRMVDAPLVRRATQVLARTQTPTSN